MEFVFPAPITVNSAMEEYAQLVPLASKLTQQVSVFLNAKQHVQPVLIINQVSAFLAIVVQITIVLQILAHWISLVTVTLPALTVETDLTIFQWVLLVCNVPILAIVFNAVQQIAQVVPCVCKAFTLIVEYVQAVTALA